MTNRFAAIEGSHFQRLRLAFLELVSLASTGDAITPEERKTLEEIAIAFVARETELRIAQGRYTFETLELAREQLIELSTQEIVDLTIALDCYEAGGKTTEHLRQQFAAPAPRVFLRFDTPEERAERQARQVRSALDADRLKPGPWIETPPDGARVTAIGLVNSAREDLIAATHAWGRSSPLDNEQELLREIITRAAYLWSALRSAK